MGDFIVLAVLAVIVGSAIYKLYKKHKNGGGCSCDCDCGNCKGCH